MTYIGKTLDSFRCLLQYYNRQGKCEHREVLIHAYSEDGARQQADSLARQLPGGQVLSHNLKQLYE